MNASLQLFEPPPCAAGSAKHVLVLDDDSATLRLTALYLAHSGYHVDAAEDGEAGWKALECGSYDLLITDNEMPCLTGLELIERLRDSGRSIPVIIASGSVDLHDSQDYPELAIAAVFHKPFPLTDLVEAALSVAPVPAGGSGGSVHRLTPIPSRTCHSPRSPHRNDSQDFVP